MEAGLGNWGLGLSQEDVKSVSCFGKCHPRVSMCHPKSPLWLGLQMLLWIAGHGDMGTSKDGPQSGIDSLGRC